jgi:hypothetical protein
LKKKERIVEEGIVERSTCFGLGYAWFKSSLGLGNFFRSTIACF